MGGNYDPFCLLADLEINDKKVAIVIARLPEISKKAKGEGGGSCVYLEICYYNLSVFLDIRDKSIRVRFDYYC